MLYVATVVGTQYTVG